jgi:formylglycine-generating enzyme required for sulfatase activity
MARIAGGTFRMGDGKSEDNPVHEVRVAAFELDVTEVTVAAYTVCVQRGACSPPATTGIYNGRDTGPRTTCNGDRPDRRRHPVNCVDWEQATAYCRAAGKRLPTEEEWEYAARGGADGRTYSWGEATPRYQLCWSRGHRRNNTCAVGSFPRGAYGLADMAGNVLEWTASEYQAGEVDRVLRGGNWLDDEPSDVRGAVRLRYAPLDRNEFIGFRCARSTP